MYCIVNRLNESENTMKLNFNEMNLNGNILKAFEEMGFKEATPIQSEAIPYVLEGKDVIGLAQTGTGKTCAFGAPILNNIDVDDDHIQALIVCPTRELAMQITEQFRKYGKYLEKIRTTCVYGGQSIDYQIKSLKKKPQIVVGTPGRIIDHINRKTIRLDNLKALVLDEADEMLNMGFKEDIDEILKSANEDRQTLLFSATMPKEILEITKTYQKDPVTVKINPKDVTVKNIKQYYIDVNEQDKVEVISRLFDANLWKLSLVFCNTKKKVDEVTTELHERGYRVKSLHGDMKQLERDQVMNLFRKNQLDIVIASDVAARGIDVDDIDAVINYDICDSCEYYVHRIGRTGRANREGKSYILVTNRQKNKLKQIEKHIKSSILPAQIPSLEELSNLRSQKVIENIKTQLTEVNDDAMTIFSELVASTKQDPYTLGSLILQLYLQKEMPLRHTEIFSNEDSGVEKGKKRIFINMGRNDKANVGQIVRLIASRANISSKLIGAIKLEKEYLYAEVDELWADEVLVSCNGFRLNDKKLILSYDLNKVLTKSKDNKKSNKKDKKDRKNVSKDKFYADTNKKSKKKAKTTFSKVMN